MPAWIDVPSRDPSAPKMSPRIPIAAGMRMNRPGSSRKAVRHGPERESGREVAGRRHAQCGHALAQCRPLGAPVAEDFAEREGWASHRDDRRSRDPTRGLCRGLGRDARDRARALDPAPAPFLAYPLPVLRGQARSARLPAGPVRGPDLVRPPHRSPLSVEARWLMRLPQRRDCTPASLRGKGLSGR